MATKNRKDTILESEPAWKKRRREGVKGQKKAKLWVVIALIAGVAVIALMMFLMLRPPSHKEKKAAEKTVEGRAVVVDKAIETKGGKTQHYIDFKRGSVVVRWKASESDYNQLKKGQIILLEYVPGFTGEPMTVVKWYPWVEAKPGDLDKKPDKDKEPISKEPEKK